MAWETAMERTRGTGVGISGDLSADGWVYDTEKGVWGFRHTYLAI